MNENRSTSIVKKPTGRTVKHECVLPRLIVFSYGKSLDIQWDHIEKEGL